MMMESEAHLTPPGLRPADPCRYCCLLVMRAGLEQEYEILQNLGKKSVMASPDELYL